MSIPRSERLKSEKLIARLFKSGKQVFHHPVKLIYDIIDETEILESKVLFAVSAPKRNFKKAVDRNKIKRLVREAYRLNRDILINDINEPIIIMAIYTAKSIEPYSKIESSIVNSLTSLHSKIKSNAS